MRAGGGDIELAGLCRSYDGVTNVVDGVNLKIPDGAYCCFLGPSGCGKTTILRMIAGHEDPTKGEIVKALFEITKNVEVVKKQVMRLEKRDDSTLL